MYDIEQRVDDTWNIAQGSINGKQPVPTKTGNGVRQARFQSERQGTARRNMVRWFLPETGIVEMYINPQSIRYSEKKSIQETRTRSGFITQYWGEELESLNISGTTGSSGVEGINVLRDIYRNEQVSMDPLAIAVTAYKEKQAATNALPGGSLLEGIGNVLQGTANDIFSSVNNLVEFGTINPNRPRPTLASMAGTVEMYWSGWVFRGFFTSFDFDEQADNLGLFNYNMNFKVTQMRGTRQNFMPWHRPATAGPSNSGSDALPHSFGSLADPLPIPKIQNKDPADMIVVPPSTNEDLTSDRPLIGGQYSKWFA